MRNHPPQGIEERHWTSLDAWRRRASPLSLVVFGTVVVLGLTGFFGHERDWVEERDGARLEVHAPEIIRNGEFFEIRIGVRSERPIEDLSIGVAQTLWEDVTVNTMLPAPSEEGGTDGEFRFGFGELPADTAFLLKVDLQINPDILGGNVGAVTVYDGGDPIAQVDVGITVLP
jgi:hypothetical protein